MIKVLIVEDDPMVREINSRFLEKVEGFILKDSVNSLEKAKEVILKETIDLILLDVFFPQGKGIELLKWIRSQNIKCDVILITADRNSETVEEAFRYGAVDYLVKPFMFNRFKEALLLYKERKESFENIDNIEQNIIDKYVIKDNKLLQEYGDIEFDEIIDIKGFNKHTYERILEGIYQMKGKPFTSQQIAKLVGVSRITARRYLDYLEKENKLEIEMEYGKIGRPINKYRLKLDK
ncbi:two-component system, CitB family, response regulator/two-component system, CitB family, response regulator MalR [Caloramator quimbayensis]|uniref:Transcriptional regulatory protein n=1 Tax=Caloramator quimbayensis TaxID=1147123 RepID=A0A1T4WP43_9CLOT|nr:response regulator [Caloramator quimbayensis]SKA79124.1 two-component system, CitB family, response regulator/two-component system, CitB family, response regulator MalR [Caloramator quimbayensis]